MNLTRASCTAAWAVCFALVGSSGGGCASGPAIPAPRPDDILTRVLPGAHTISPTPHAAVFSAVPPSAPAPVRVRFEAQSIDIVEPSFSEPHGLEWSMGVKRATARRLNALLGSAPNDPVAELTITFTVVDEHRERNSNTDVHVALDALLPDGRRVLLPHQVGRFTERTDIVVPVVIGVFGALVAGAAVSVAIESAADFNAPAEKRVSALRKVIGLEVAALALVSAGGALTVKADLDAEQRWANVYDGALIALAGEIRALPAAALPAAQPPDPPPGANAPSGAPSAPDLTTSPASRGP